MTELTQLAVDQKLETLPPDATVFEAAQMMSQNKVGSILVMDDGKLVGIFTERDLVNRVVAEGLDYRTILIKDYMSTNITRVNENESVTNCYELMRKNKCRHLPIVNDKKNIVGMVSMRDLLDWMIREKEFENKELKHYICS